jgi:type II secretory pathway component PulK
MSEPLHNQRGIALIITLLIVALLTITVVDFTYSVEVDEQMAHNALKSLQAELLARSGINLGEAFLLQDADPTVDAFTEPWCPQPGPNGQSCQIDETNGQLVLPANMRLRVEILDEGGKLNINLTRPPNVNIWRYTLLNPNNQVPAVFQSWGLALVQLLQERNVDPDVADSLTEYWNQLYANAYGAQLANGAGQPGAAPQPVATPTPPNSPLIPELVWDFPSLDDASIVPGLTPDAINRLRPVLTALPFMRQSRINANTAPVDVLAAVIPDGGTVENIVAQRQQAPLKAADLAQMLGGINPNDPVGRNVRVMLGVQSAYFLIRASAIVDPNPATGLGGVSRSASMLVQRAPNPRVPFGAAVPPGMSRWTLTQLDWQKEAGAALFMPKTDQGSGAAGFPTPVGG